MTDGRCPRCARPGPAVTCCEDDACARLGIHRLPLAWCLAEPSTDPVVGRMLDAWLVLARIGAGGAGAVYLVEQQPVGLRAALKLIGGEYDHLANPTRFLREAAALARLTHPNIVRLLAYGVYARHPYLVMEYVEGARTLGAVLSRLDMAARCRVLVQITHALEAAHAAGVVHRDLKPDNIMIQEVAGEPHFVRLVDFGLAKFTDDSDQSAVALGSPRYMAPEQVNQTPVGPWTDIYALGVIALEMFTGKRAFQAETVNAVMLIKADPAHDPVAACRVALAPPVAAFLRRALAADPAARFPDAASLRAALLQLGDIEPSLEATAPRAGDAPPRRRRRRWPWAAGLLVGGGGLLALAALGPDRVDPEPDAGLPVSTAPPPIAPPVAAVDAAMDAAPLDAAPDAAPVDARPADAGLADRAPPDAARRRSGDPPRPPRPRPPVDPALARPSAPDASAPPKGLTFDPSWTREMTP